jgi:hypothetical protein
MGATCRPCGLTCEGTIATTRAGSPFLAHRACHAPGWSERPDLPSKSSMTRCGGGVGGTRGARREGGKRVILHGTPFLLLGTIMPNMIWADEQDTSNFYMCHFCRVMMPIVRCNNYYMFYFHCKTTYCAPAGLLFVRSVKNLKRSQKGTSILVYGLWLLVLRTRESK